MLLNNCFQSIRVGLLIISKMLNVNAFVLLCLEADEVTRQKRIILAFGLTTTFGPLPCQQKIMGLLVFKFIMALQNTPNITFRMPTNHNIYQYFVIGQGLSN